VTLAWLAFKDAHCSFLTVAVVDLTWVVRLTISAVAYVLGFVVEWEAVHAIITVADAGAWSCFRANTSWTGTATIAKFAVIDFSAVQSIARVT
jgi:hypothetical protein